MRALLRRGLIGQLRAAMLSHRSAPPGTCPLCKFEGKFDGFGNPVRTGALCPACGSLERHRLLALAIDRGAVEIAGKAILHFAPEAGLAAFVTDRGPGSYDHSSWPAQPGADLSLDIENIALADGAYDLVICCHVLEHVDDTKALAEIHRILRPSGMLVAMVPLIEGWSNTYEDDRWNGARERELYFGQHDHIRYYGADFRARVEAAGFSLEEFTAGPVDSVAHRLLRGEKVFIARKSDSP